MKLIVRQIVQVDKQNTFAGGAAAKYLPVIADVVIELLGEREVRRRTFSRHA